MNLENGVRPGKSIWRLCLKEIWEYMLQPICHLQRAIPLDTNNRPLVPWMEKYVLRELRVVTYYRDRYFNEHDVQNVSLGPKDLAKGSILGNVQCVLGVLQHLILPYIVQAQSFPCLLGTSSSHSSRRHMAQEPHCIRQVHSIPTTQGNILPCTAVGTDSCGGFGRQVQCRMERCMGSWWGGVQRRSHLSPHWWSLPRTTAKHCP